MITYLDHNATTPPHPKILDFIKEHIGAGVNPSSVHQLGRKGKALLEKARYQIAELLGFQDIFQDYRIVFTASGTEANNLLMHNYARLLPCAQIFLSSVEHLSISIWKDYAPNISSIPVDANGIIDLNELENALSISKAPVKLLSVIMANNETGVIQPLDKIIAVARKYGALVHSDIVQAAGKISVDISSLDLDFATISAHKLGGIIGAAAIIYKDKHHLQPMIIGGGQEKGIRSGTENILAITAFGHACEIAKKELDERYQHCLMLRNYLERKLMQLEPKIQIVGEKAERLPNTTLIINSFKSSEIQLITLDAHNIAVSAGSACSSGKIGVSPVLLNMGYDEKSAHSTLRISSGPGSSYEDIDKFIAVYSKINQ